jgi:hypothetical protein
VQRKLNRTWQSLAVFVALVFGMSLPIWASQERGGATPEEVFDRFTAGAKARNWEEIAACISQDGLIKMNAMMFAMGGMIVAFAQMGEGVVETMGEPKQAEQAASEVSGLEKKFEELLVRHGIDTKAIQEGAGEDQELPAAFTSPAFFTDIMRFIDELPDDKEAGSPGDAFMVPKGALENVVIEGDRATATVDGEPGEFVRVDGRWYFDLDMGREQEQGEMEPVGEESSK